jgi:uncharacterized protein YdhG (YjbR/CyaY superfamily)
VTTQSVDDYIAEFPADVQETLQALRRTIHETLPGAGEKISYRIPTITVDGRWVVYFAGWKDHISLYPVPDVDPETAEAIAPYRSGKGTLRFPLDQPMPYELITRLVRLLAAQRGVALP